MLQFPVCLSNRSLPQLERNSQNATISPHAHSPPPQTYLVFEIVPHGGRLAEWVRKGEAHVQQLAVVEVERQPDLGVPLRDGIDRVQDTAHDEHFAHLVMIYANVPPVLYREIVFVELDGGRETERKRGKHRKGIKTHSTRSVTQLFPPFLWGIQSRALALYSNSKLETVNPQEPLTVVVEYTASKGKNVSHRGNWENK